MKQEAHISRVEWSALLYQRAAFGKAREKISSAGAAMVASATDKRKGAEPSLRSSSDFNTSRPKDQGVGTSAMVFRICEAIW